MTPDTLTHDGTLYVRAYPVAPGRCPHCGAGPRAWTPAQVIAALRRHDAPKADEWLTETGGDHPAFSTVRRIFGTWNAALEAAGFPRRGCGTTVYWTHERITDAMGAWAQTHDGAPPTNEEWTKAGPDHPASRQVVARFGSWNAAIDAAGFFPRGSWGHRVRGVTGEEKFAGTMDAAPVAAAVRSYIGADGSTEAVAELLGHASPDPIRRLVNGSRRRMRVDVADEILTAIGRPDVLAVPDAA